MSGSNDNPFEFTGSNARLSLELDNYRIPKQHVLGAQPANIRSCLVQNAYVFFIKLHNEDVVAHVL